jgi:HPt (histidine-containing phosphotransfer) domain-containing protein
MQDERAKLLDCGMDDYLAKPYTVAQMRAMLSTWLVGEEGIVESIGTVDGTAPDGDSATGGHAPDDVDRSMLAQISRLKRGVLSTVIEAYLDTSTCSLDEIRAALAANDGKAVAFTAHSLKSGSAMLGAYGLAEHCADLEELGNTAAMGEAAMKFEALELVYLRVRKTLEKEMLDDREAT